mmetsp:Transcript_39813/g.71320  ORF Transcript_39813/g.71320 Transcript_39813/m.71320 type:complete len:457 (+) Transcript_39813:2304-3674(+)
MPDDTVEAPLPLADLLELWHAVLGHRKDVPLLGLVAPDLHGGHALVSTVHLPELQQGPAVTVMDNLRHSIAEPPCPHVVDALDGVGMPKGRAGIDHLLAAALHFGVVPLHTGEVQLRTGGARGHARGGAPPKPDQHGGPPQRDDAGPGGDGLLVGVHGPDGSHAANDADGLVVPTDVRPGGVPEAGVARGLVKHRAEVAGDTGAAVLVVERRPTEGGLGHDLVRVADAAGGADVLLPLVREAGDEQVGDGEPDAAGLWLGPGAAGPLVADLPTRPGGGPGPRRHGRGVVVGLHLADELNRLFLGDVVMGGCAWPERQRIVALQDGPVVGVRAEYPLGVQLVRVLDHLEEGVLHIIPINVPRCVEYLVPAVLGVHLGKHHQLDVGGIPVEPLGPKGGVQVLHLLRGKGQAPFLVLAVQLGPPLAHDVHRPQPPGLPLKEEVLRLLQRGHNALGHAVV